MECTSPHVSLTNLKIYIDGLVFVHCTRRICNLIFIVMCYVI